MRSPWLASMFAFALLSASVAAPVQAARPSVVAMNKAKAHFKKGRELQHAGAYDEAIDEYKHAYRLAPRPELLFNIAQCHRLAGHAGDAIEYYQRFLDSAPDDPAADEARGHVASLRQQMAAQLPLHAPGPAAATPAPAPPAPRAPASSQAPVVRKQEWPAPAPTTPRTVVQTQPARPPDLAIVADPAPARHPSDRTRSMKWAGVTGVVAGATLVGTGALFGWRAAQTADEIDNSSGFWTQALADREERARADERRFYYLAGGGSALILAGAALWWFGSDDDGGVQARPTVDPERAGLVVRGKF